MISYEDGIDISNYTAPLTASPDDPPVKHSQTAPLTISQRAYIKEHFDFVIIGLQDAAKARAFKQQLEGWIRLEYYVDIPGRNLTIPDTGSRVWIDVETGCFVRRQDVLAEIPKLYSAGLLPGIYCNQPSYMPVFGSSTELSYLPLWYANYREPDFDTFVPFNGWTRPLIWQYSSAGVAGINCDLNRMEVADMITRRSADGHFIEMLDPSGFVIYRWGSNDGSSGSRQSRPRNGDIHSPDHWEWLRTASGSKHAYWSLVEGD